MRLTQPQTSYLTQQLKTCFAKYWSSRQMKKLKKLKKGECVTCGGMVKNGKWSKYEPRIIKITSFQERLR